MSWPARFAVISILRSLRSYLPVSEIEPPEAEIDAESVCAWPSGSMEMVAVELPDLNLKSKPLLKGASFASTESPAGGVEASGTSAGVPFAGETRSPAQTAARPATTMYGRTHGTVVATVVWRMWGGYPRDSRAPSGILPE